MTQGTRKGNATVLSRRPGTNRLSRLGRDIALAFEAGLYHVVGRLAAADGAMGEVIDPLASCGDYLAWPVATLAAEAPRQTA